MGVSIQLKNCPYCGAAAEIVERYGNATQDRVTYVVRCTNADCIGRNQKQIRNLYKAVALWNRRNNEQPVN